MAADPAPERWCSESAAHGAKQRAGVSSMWHLVGSPSTRLASSEVSNAERLMSRRAGKSALRSARVFHLLLYMLGISIQVDVKERHRRFPIPVRPNSLAWATAPGGRKDSWALRMVAMIAEIDVRAIPLGGTGTFGGATALLMANPGWTVAVTGRDRSGSSQTSPARGSPRGMQAVGNLTMMRSDSSR